MVLQVQVARVPLPLLHDGRCEQQDVLHAERYDVVLARRVWPVVLVKQHHAGSVCQQQVQHVPAARRVQPRLRLVHGQRRHLFASAAAPGGRGRLLLLLLSLPGRSMLLASCSSLGISVAADIGQIRIL